MKHAVAAFVLFAAFSITGCKKDDTLSEVSQPKILLRSIDYKTFNARAEYFYNPDSTLQKIRVSTGPTGHITTFSYANKKLTKSFVSSSLYENTFHYDDGKIIRELSTLKNQPQLGHRLDFEYDSRGKVSQLKYYHLNEAGEHLQYTTGYEYDASGLPLRIKSVSGSTSVTWQIEGYSSPADFNPWAFISSSLDQLYELYNYPVLSKLDRLPRKITQLVKIGDAAPYVEKVIEIDFQISARQLNKSITRVKYPTHPEFDNSSEVEFHY